MKLSNYVIIICFLAISLETAHSAKIVFLIAFSSRSHMNIFYPLIGGLHARGHEVVVYTPYTDTVNYPQVKQIELSQCKRYLLSMADRMVEVSNEGFLAAVDLFKEIVTETGSAFFAEPEVQRLIKEKPEYDLFLTDILFSDFVFPMAKHVFKAPTVFVSTSVLLTGMSHFLNVPRPFSYVPDEMTMVPSKMSFSERVDNTIASLISLYFWKFMEDMCQEEASKHLIGAPSIQEAKANVDLVLVNSDLVMDVPNPLLPNIINIGGIHCVDPKPLPKELEDFVAGSGEHGFIFFSIGSVMKGTRLPKQAKMAFVEAFAQIKQRVIWKFEDPIENLSNNVKLTKWANQQDLLGHPKIRLFITHNGLLGTQEAVYHAVPMIGLPVYADQHSNNAKAHRKGFAEKLNIYSITAEEIVTTINKIVNDKRYKEAAVNNSAIMRDLPMKPLDTAIFWTEYVIRNRGSQHLVPAARHLNLFQYFLLDVMGLAIIVILGIALVLIFTIKFIIKFFQKNVLKTKNKHD